MRGRIAFAFRLDSDGFGGEDGWREAGIMQLFITLSIVLNMHLRQLRGRFGKKPVMYFQSRDDNSAIYNLQPSRVIYSISAIRFMVWPESGITWMISMAFYLMLIKMP
jgi:hypothetical protein